MVRRRDNRDSSGGETKGSFLFVSLSLLAFFFLYSYRNILPNTGSIASYSYLLPDMTAPAEYDDDEDDDVAATVGDASTSVQKAILQVRQEQENHSQKWMEVTNDIDALKEQHEQERLALKSEIDDLKTSLHETKNLLAEHEQQQKQQMQAVVSEPKERQQKQQQLSHDSLTPPPSCTQQQLAAIGTRPLKTKKTNCPNPGWLTDYYTESDNTIANQFTALWLGCTNGFEAVDALRMGSSNPDVDKDKWHDTMEKFGATTGACKQGDAAQFDITRQKAIPGRVFCVEALPANYEALQKSNDIVGFEKLGFYTHHAAISNVDGTALFPGGGNKVGVEDIGLGVCERNPESCVNVPSWTVDTYVNKFVDNSNGGDGDSTGIIDILSIDTEGYDLFVLQGSTATLSRVVYLEFEYHKVGQWAKHDLSEAIDILSKENFVCYWAGKNRLWRITGCWMDNYNTKRWSNVACINYNLPQSKELADRMEQVFHNTIGYTANTA